MLTRRVFLGSSIAAGAVLCAAQPSFAELGNGCRRFIFLNAQGGWDPLCVFAPLFGSANIEMEPAAEPWTIGGLDLVDHPDRPVTRAFFEAHHADVALLHGVSTRSVNHETCQIVALTGSTSEDRPDFATILGHAERDSASLPHLVMSGPAFAGPYSVFVSNAQGLLQQTIDGTILTLGDTPLELPNPVAGRMVDRFLIDRSEALQLEHDGIHVDDYGEAIKRAKELNDSRLELQLQSSASFGGRAQTAIAAMAAGVCRCVSIGTGFNWDTHNDNTLQTTEFESFFGDLELILATLASTVDPQGRPLSESTIIVVTSEMARTPAYNATGGRDHWPFTSMFLMGPGIQGNRSYGGYTDLYTGIGVDQGGDPDQSQPGISAEALGATLLALGDLDPEEHLRGAKPIPGVLG